ncbi:hypothetical protein QN277_016774 [Acacia crassicarpa]|uniref:Uncharacterized protein n=1 Tax=Acacia crassicarpa TaxID=499986 RepID=A0AAE1MXB9_9FABA|nr:hypothetical protein QN277_016774 [Acacia crassicarpa]
MDAQTLTLRRMYDQVKVRHQFLFNLKEALPCGFSEEMEEEMEGIEKFIKDFVLHVLWIKTKGEEGVPWSCTSNNDGKSKEQHLNATSQVEISNPSVPIPTQAEEVKQVQKRIEESSLPFGNDSILIEVDSSLTLTNEAIHNLSDNEVDDDIIVESPQMFENVIAQTISSSSSDPIVLVDDCAPTSLGDVLIVENDESCMDDNVIDLSEKGLSLEKDISLDSNELHDSFIREDSIILTDDITNETGSFHMILSCDLPPDINKENDSFENSKVLGGNNFKNFLSSSTLLPSISCDCNVDVVCPNTKLDSAPSLLQTREFSK